MPRSKSSKIKGGRSSNNRVGGGGLIQSGILTYRVTDFVDYVVPGSATPVPDSIGQYGLAPINTIPGMFGTSDDLKKLSLPAVRPRRLNLSVLPYAGVPNPEPRTFTVRSACPIAYPTLAGSTNPQITAAWNQQSTLVTPSVNQTFTRVATWDFSRMPPGTVFQTATDTDETKAVMGLVNWQVLNVNSDNQYTNDVADLKLLQFRIEVEFDLPMPALSQIRNAYKQAVGERYFTEYDPANRAGDSNAYLLLEGMRRTTETLPNPNTVHGRMQLFLEGQRLAREEEQWLTPTAPPCDDAVKPNFFCGCGPRTGLYPRL